MEENNFSATIDKSKVILPAMWIFEIYGVMFSSCSSILCLLSHLNNENYFYKGSRYEISQITRVYNYF